MLNILGTPGRTCQGVSRRELLRAGTLAMFGGALLPQTALAAAGKSRPAKAKAVILVDLFGGPSHLDMFDPKPNAPVEVRGEFASIESSMPGVRVCEHLPLLARRLHRTTLVRTVSHPYNSHNPYAVMTGFTGGVDNQDYYSRPTDHPSMGSLCHYFGLTTPGVPPYVVLPALPGYSQGLRRCGPYGGYLGKRYDPLFATCDPKFAGELSDAKNFYDDSIQPLGDPLLPSLTPELTLDVLDRRRSLLSQLEAKAALVDDAPSMMTHWQHEAFELLLAPRTRGAFDLSQEPDAVRERYGRDLFGSSLLLARRLVENGVTFVTVHTESKPNGHWDTHNNNFNMLKNIRLPVLDRCVSALLDDLDERGLLASTLVMVTGDMGRTPKVNKQAGRDHWPQCGFCLLAGGGMQQGLAYGRSDNQGAYPLDRPVSPGDLVSTAYHLLGLDPHATVNDTTGRPIGINQGGQPLLDAII